MCIRKLTHFRMLLGLLILLFIQACASPVATYQEVLEDANKATANNVTAMAAYYTTANRLALKSYLDSRMRDLVRPNYSKMKHIIIMQPEQIRKRVTIFNQLSAFSNATLQMALAKDAAEFKAKADQASEVAAQAAKTLKDVASIAATAGTPLAGVAVNSIPAPELVKSLGEQLSNLGQYYLEAKAKHRLDATFTKENMDKVNMVLVALTDDMITCANILEGVVQSDSSHELVDFIFYQKYMKDLREKNARSQVKVYAEAWAGFVTERDDVVSSMMQVLQVQAEPATEGLSAWIALNNGLIVYAKSGQTKADKDALRALAKTALASSNMVLESLKIYEGTKTSEKTSKQ